MRIVYSGPYSRALDEDVRPDEARLHVHRGNALKVDAHLVVGEPGALPSDDRCPGHLDDGREEGVPPGGGSSPPGCRPTRSGRGDVACHTRVKTRACDAPAPTPLGPAP